MNDVNSRYKKAAGLRLNQGTIDAAARALTGEKSPPAYAMPFGGLKNTPGLPPFEKPGQFSAGYLPQMPPPEVYAPQSPPQIPRPGAPMPQQQAPMPRPIAPPETVYMPEAQAPALPDLPPTVMIGQPDQQQQMARKLLPEQWRGSFGNWQET